jgi:hypothetical protein
MIQINKEMIMLASQVAVYYCYYYHAMPMRREAW